MDPKATLELCDQAISDLELIEARQYLDSYYKWRGVGGFEPVDVTGNKRGDVFATECARRIRSVYLSKLKQPNN